MLHILKRKPLFDLHGIEIVKAILQPKGQDTEDGGQVKPNLQTTKQLG